LAVETIQQSDRDQIQADQVSVAALPTAFLEGDEAFGNEFNLSCSHNHATRPLEENGQDSS